MNPRQLKVFDRAGQIAWRARRIEDAMRYWRVYLYGLDMERQSWYGINTEPHVQGVLRGTL